MYHVRRYDFLPTSSQLSIVCIFTLFFNKWCWKWKHEDWQMTVLCIVYWEKWKAWEPNNQVLTVAILSESCIVSVLQRRLCVISRHQLSLHTVLFITSRVHVNYNTWITRMSKNIAMFMQTLVIIVNYCHLQIFITNWNLIRYTLLCVKLLCAK